MRKNRTREERRRRQTAARVLISIAMVAAVMWSFISAVGAESTPTVDEYLASIGADNAQREHVMNLYEEWEG